MFDAVLENGSVDKIIQTLNQRYATGRVTEDETLRWNQLFKERIRKMRPAWQGYDAPLFWTDLVKKLMWEPDGGARTLLLNLKIYPKRGPYGFESSVVIWSLKRNEDVGLRDLDLVSMILSDVSDRRGWRQEWPTLEQFYGDSFKQEALDHIFETWLNAIHKAQKSTPFDINLVTAQVVKSLDVLPVDYDSQTQDMIRRELGEKIHKFCESRLVAN